MIGLSVIAVKYFTTTRKRIPRIPVQADWNAIPIREINHKSGENFLNFFYKKMRPVRAAFCAHMQRQLRMGIRGVSCPEGHTCRRGKRVGMGGACRRKVCSRVPLEQACVAAVAYGNGRGRSGIRSEANRGFWRGCSGRAGGAGRALRRVIQSLGMQFCRLQSRDGTPAKSDGAPTGGLGSGWVSRGGSAVGLHKAPVDHHLRQRCNRKPHNGAPRAFHPLHQHGPLSLNGVRARLVVGFARIHIGLQH